MQRDTKSESRPSDWDSYDVKVIVGKYFEDFVDDKHRTVLMLYCELLCVLLLVFK